MEKMKAALVYAFDRPLVIEEVPKPQAGEGEVVVRIEASGLCHSDIHLARGEWPVKPPLPFIPGHEGVGIVVEVGPGVRHLQEGDRVAVPFLGYACGLCPHCVSGWETLCEHQLNTGFTLPGGYAEYVKAFANYAVKVPKGVDPADAAPITCAGVTTYKAVKVGGVGPSDLVAIYGFGGLGHLALQYARIAGGTGVVVDLNTEKLNLARELGAEYTINAQEEDPGEAIRRLGGADVAIVTAVSSKAFEQAYRSLRRGGRLVLVGLPPDNTLPLPIFETVLNGIHILGSIVGTRLDLAEALELQAAGKTRVHRETRRLEEVNQAFDEVVQGRAKARLVFDLRA